MRTHSNAGFCQLEYLRELTAVAVIMAVLLMLAGSATQPSSQAAALAKAVSKAPIYGIGFESASNKMWVNQLFTGLTEYAPETGEMTSQWPGQRRSLTDVARGGSDVITTALSESVGAVIILRDDEVKVRYQLPRPDQALTDIDVSNDGNVVVGTHPSGELLVWTWNGEVFELKTVKFPIRADLVQISADGRQLAVSVGTRTIEVWNLTSLRPLWSCDARHARITQLAWSPDGKVLASGGEDGRVRLWDAAERTVIRELQADTFAPSSLTFSADGRHLVAGGFEKLVRVWSVADGRLLTTLAGHTGPVRAAAFDPAGSYLATGDLTGNIRIWSAKDFRLIREM